MLYKTSWKQLVAKARNGNANAQIEVADYFTSGLRSETNETIVRQNFSAALRWYRKAALNGVVDALTNIADFLSEGKGCEKNMVEAEEKYLLAVEKGSSRAAFNLGTLYRDKRNFKKSFKYYCLANKMGPADYSSTVGLCYYYGIGVSMNKEIACRYFLNVSAGDLQKHSPYEIDEANYMLGLAHLTGEGVTKSLAKSQQFLQQANRDNDHRSAEQLLFIIGWRQD